MEAPITFSMLRIFLSTTSNLTRGSLMRTLRVSLLAYLAATMAGELPSLLLRLRSTPDLWRMSTAASGMLNLAAVWRAVCP